ncbi:hypothetical protein CASFOL_028279 [Castilleja foliolosa]|uniref:Magnesium transporter n=1 Tax=Castilleja foliolosa TaxID=1961234 RepID=A0ABD3CEX0_9LAMI
MAAAEVVNATSDSYNAMSSDNIKGLVLGLSSSLFIGASFIVKKKGLKKAGASGVRADLDGRRWEKETQAKRRVGLWSLPNPEMPWDWRKDRREDSSSYGQGIGDDCGQILTSTALLF